MLSHLLYPIGAPAAASGLQCASNRCRRGVPPRNARCAEHGTRGARYGDTPTLVSSTLRDSIASRGGDFVALAVLGAFTRTCSFAASGAAGADTARSLV